jgi:hypothetical protein
MSISCSELKDMCESGEASATAKRRRQIKPQFIDGSDDA